MRNRFYVNLASVPSGVPLAPVCSNCGGGEFVWVNDLRTGSIGRGSLSIRSGGELSLGTRICRGCGHADLFLKDPSILRMPHQWRPGEFVPIPGRPSSPPPPSPSPTSPSTPAPVPPPPEPVPAPAPPPVAEAPPAPPDAPPTESGSTVATEEPTPPAETPAPAKKPARRRAAKAKAPDETS